MLITNQLLCQLSYAGKENNESNYNTVFAKLLNVPFTCKVPIWLSMFTSNSITNVLCFTSVNLNVFLHSFERTRSSVTRWFLDTVQLVLETRSKRYVSSTVVLVDVNCVRNVSFYVLTVGKVVVQRKTGFLWTRLNSFKAFACSVNNTVTSNVND